MIQHVLHSYAMNLGYAKSLVKDVPPDKMAAQPRPGMNHAAWVLGHLATSSGFLAELLGRKVDQPADWQKLFGMHSKPAADAKQYPSKEQLVAALEGAHKVVEEGMRALAPARLAEPLPVADLRKIWPTLGDAVVFMAAAHEGIHLGQLSAWRRAMGLPPVF